MDTVETVIVGAGVIGLAVARALALAGREVIVLEEQDSIGTQTSSRNSEVIHAGIYYPHGSLKAQLCVDGRERLYRYCAEHGVPHRPIGKLIVATSAAELPQLSTIRKRAAANGVDDLRPVDGAELQDLEPDLAGAGALLSPSTGIVDSHALMRSLQRDAEAAGAAIALCSRVAGGAVYGAPEARFVVEVDGSGTLGCSTLINCAGLGAWRVARALDGVPAESIPPRRLAKGNYCALAAGRAPFDRLIYPVPVDGGLGIHLTLDLGGAARFGPDVEWLDAGDEVDGDRDGQDPIDYTVEDGLVESFATSIRRYWPGLPDDALRPDYAGVRPKVSGPGDPAGDFVIAGPADHGIDGFVALYGIESPGLTASLAIADRVARMVGL
ncbi:NAD(P)/FAD-dependent oxidoreductase [Gordonia sinesedis]